MPWDEIKVPKELREFMPSYAEETALGHRNGAKKQYRYGNLHIREYDDKFLVHSDRVDPRKDLIGHLVYDAPEVLVGLACAVFGAAQAAKKLQNSGSSKPKQTAPPGILLPAAAGYLGYAAARKIKDYLER